VSGADGGPTPRPQLLLDVGGVILGEIRPFMEWLAHTSGVDQATGYDRWRTEARDATWSGRWSETDFWEWVARRYPGTGEPWWLRARLAEAMAPLPAYSRVPAWAGAADVSVLSNHRLAWIEPPLTPLRPHLKHLLVSERIGLRKPQGAVYEHAAALLPAGAPVLFVDNQAQNLPEAAALGWRTLLADPDGRWIADVEAWLDAAVAA
jgi:FMN phosphatase YigB (HAD superfamily)